MTRPRHERTPELLHKLLALVVIWLAHKLVEPLCSLQCICKGTGVAWCAS